VTPNACELSVIVPAFQEGRHLQQSLLTIGKHVAGITPDYEIIVVDDGSSDNTWAILAELHRANSCIKALRLSRNFGKDYAIAAGMEYCRGRAAVIIDADLQHPPELIAKFFQIWKSGQALVVEGVKQQRREEPLLRRSVSRAFNRVASRAAGIDFTNSTDFKLLDRQAINAWLAMPERRCFFRGMASWLGFPHVQVEFEVQPRQEGHSKFNLVSLTRLAWLAISSYSVTPLRLIHLWAAAFLAFAVGLTARSLYLWFAGRAAGGMTTVVILILLLGGLLLLSLGIVAEYVAAIYEEIKGRPRYIIADRLE
jgi:glycosyltransferase involved in cell wall biosynthesis